MKKMLPIPQHILKAHKQITIDSCIGMSFELVLKLIGRLQLNATPYQYERLGKEANSDWIDGKIIEGITKIQFHRLFFFQRSDSFPFEGLFSTIENELKHDRYVIISLSSEGGNWHNWVIYGMENNDFLAVSKAFVSNTTEYVEGEILKEENVKSIVRAMKGTDIITYTPITN